VISEVLRFDNISCRRGLPMVGRLRVTYFIKRIFALSMGFWNKFRMTHQQRSTNNQPFDKLRIIST